MPTAERFFSHVDITNGCWLWTGALDRKGYGRMGDGTKRTVFAHRFAWRQTRGPIPAGLHVLHACDTPACVRPAHLFLGTHADNMADMTAKGRSTRGERNGQSKLTRELVIDARVRYSQGETLHALAKEYGVGVPALSMAVSGKRWGHIHG